MANFSQIGRRLPLLDAEAKAKGQTRFASDMALPRMLHGKILRSPWPHARLLGVDTSRAERLPGVKAVITGRDTLGVKYGNVHVPEGFRDRLPLAMEKVRYIGDEVAAVAAVTEQIALEALDRIKVEYEPLPAVFDPLEAMREDAPKVHAPASNIYETKVIRKGDADAALAGADHVFERQYRTQMVEHAPLEPHAAIAVWDPNGRVTIHTTLGRITLGRADISRTLKLPLNRVRIVATIVGGNFGGKNEITQEPVLALLSKKTGRPVKGVFTRGEEFASSTTRHPFIMDYKTGVSKDGRIIARKVRLVLDGGAYCSWSETTLGKACILSTGPYRIDNLLVEAYAVYTNKTMTGAMRGFGAPQVCFAYESQMDEIAATLGMDPLEIRLLNAFEEGTASPTGQGLHSVVLKDSLLRAAQRFGWKEPRS